MAMTFTIVTHLRERLSVLMREREERIQKEATEKERRALEVCTTPLVPAGRRVHTDLSRRLRKREPEAHL